MSLATADPARPPASGRSPEGGPGQAPAPSLAASVLWLMRARWRIAWNGFRRGARWRRFMYGLVALAVGFLAFVALIASYVLTRFIVELTERPEAADLVLASALSAGLMLSFMVSFTVALAALFLSKDLDMLLAAPVSRRAVFLSKLLGGLLPAQTVILTVTAVPMIGHGLAMDYDAAYFLGMLVALLILPLLPMAVGAVAVVLIVRQVSARRLGEVVGLIVVAMTLSIALVAGSARQLRAALTLADLLTAVERLRSPYSPAEWLSRALAATGRHDWAGALPWLALALLVSLAALLPLIAVSDRRYYEGWMHMQSTDQRTTLRRSRLPWARVDRAADLGRPSGLWRWLSPPAVAVMRKDWRVIPRDLTSIAQVLAPLSIGVFFILQQLIYPVRIGGSDVPQPFVAPLLAMLSAAVATGVSGMIMVRFELTAFSLEGRAYWLLKSAPIGRRELIAAKYWVGYAPYLFLGTVLILLLELARALADTRLSGAPLSATFSAIEPALVGYAWFLMAVVGAGILALNLALGTARPNMRWDTPHEMLTPDLGCLSLVLYGGYAFVAGLCLALPMAASRFAVIREPAWLWIAGLGLGLGLTAIVVAGSLWLAMAEVDAIGEGEE